MSNDTRRGAGRFCNHVVRNIVCSILAEKHDLKFIYGYANEIKMLGIPLFESGTKMHEVLMYRSEEHTSELQSH